MRSNEGGDEILVKLQNDLLMSCYVICAINGG